MLKFANCRNASLPALAAMLILAGPVHARTQTDPTPEIRTTATNQVPACVTPERLMTFLKGRNGRLDPRFKDIAQHYKTYGDGWHVRWDYAFYQMAVETNFLTYRRPDGRMGDVDPMQNNFAGIGTTGGGVPGDGFPDVKTGVLAQIQHLVAYSGEHLAAPVASRTQLKQDDIVLASQELGRPVHFSDLSHRWAVDRKYGQSIEWVAGLYRNSYCTGKEAAAAPAAPAPSTGEALPWLAKDQPSLPQKKSEAPAAVPAPTPAPASGPNPQTAARSKTAVRTIWSASSGAAAAASRPLATAAASQSPANDLVHAASPATISEVVTLSDQVPAAGSAAGPQRTDFDPATNPPAGLGAKPATCRILTASYGGTKTLLIRSQSQGEKHYTALTVLDGFEKSMRESYIKGRAPGGEPIGEFATKDEAMAKARQHCPGG